MIQGKILVSIGRGHRTRTLRVTDGNHTSEYAITAIETNFDALVRECLLRAGHAGPLRPARRLLRLLGSFADVCTHQGRLPGPRQRPALPCVSGHQDAGLRFGGTGVRRIMPKLHRMNDELVAFRCPGCNSAHAVKVSNGGWQWNGDMAAPTFQPSLKVTYPANPAALEEFKEWRTERICHSFVTNGRIQFLDDCSHALRGQTVEIPEWPI